MDRRDFFAATAAATVVAAAASRSALAATSDNPFLQAWTLPDGAPPFDLIKEEHFLPAIEAGITERRAEIRSITMQRRCRPQSPSSAASSGATTCASRPWRSTHRPSASRCTSRCVEGGERSGSTAL